MSINFILNDEAVNDQTTGLQTADGADGFIDTDVAYSALPAAFRTYLETTLGLNSTFPTGVGVATKTNSVTVSSTGQLNTIKFTDGSGGALDGDDSLLDTVDGVSILLFADGDNTVIGRRADNNAVVFVIFKEDVVNAAGTSADVTFHVVTYAPVKHTNTTDADDAVDLGNTLKLAASEEIVFSFAGTPSGNHLFTMVASGTTGLVVTPETEVIKLHISQGGGPTTLGVFNQMIDPDETMMFTFVTTPNAATTVPNLSQGEADAETNILFGGLHTITSGSVAISQTQGNDPAGMKLTAYNTKGDGNAAEPNGDGFIGGYANDPIVAITEVRVFDDAGALLLTATSDVTTPVNGITVDFLASGEVEVRGLEDEYEVEYDAGSHERLKVTGVQGKFDIGGIGTETAATQSTFVGQQIVLEDDGPTTSANATASRDDDALTGGIAGGTGDDTDASNTSGTLGHAFGTDGAGSIAFLTTGAPSGFTYQLAGNDLLIKQGTTTVVTVTLNTTTGAYTVTQNNPILHATGLDENNQSFTLNYRVTDADGDTADGTLGINVDDDSPATSANTTALLDDDALTGGIAGGTGDDADASNTSGNLGHAFGADGAGSIAFLTTGAPSGFTYQLSGNDLLIKQGTTTVVTVTLNTTTGAYTVTQNNPILHATGLDENNQSFTLNYRVTDADGDTADGTLGINVDDDSPTTSANTTALLDDDALTGGIAGGTGDDADSSNTSGSLGHAFGADGAGSIAFLTTGAPSGFTYQLSGNDLLIKQGTTTVVTVTLNTTTGAYTATQNNPILHPTGLDENNQSFTLNYRVTDADGDTADGTLGINVDDDSPTIGPVADGLVDFAAGDSVTNSLNGSFGADGGATTPFTVTSSPASITILDGTSSQTTLLRDISGGGTVVTYYKDADGSGTLNAGDTQFFKLTLAGGNYTFDVLQDPPPASIEFSFAGTPSGNHLFTMVGSGGGGLVVTPETEVIKLHISQGGGPTTLGVFNQMIDPGETMMFTFVTTPDAGTTVPNLSQGEADAETNILFGGLQTITSGSVSISQTQGNDPAGMKLTAYNTKGDGNAAEPSGDGFIGGYANDPITAITEVRVFDDAGALLLTATSDVTTPVNGITVDFLASGEVEVRGLEDEYKVEYDAGSHERLKVTGVQGKFDIGGIGIEQTQPAPDEKLDFTVQITDADGDTATDSFSIGIDGTGVFDDNQVVGVNA